MSVYCDCDSIQIIHPLPENSTFIPFVSLSCGGSGWIRTNLQSVNRTPPVLECGFGDIWYDVYQLVALGWGTSNW